MKPQKNRSRCVPLSTIVNNSEGSCADLEIVEIDAICSDVAGE
jgi:hypothetical protein